MKVYQLETTNYCNANCSYCPHDKMTRPKGYVSVEIVKKVAEYCQKNNQKYIALHHMGEPLLHVKLPDIIKIFQTHNINCEFSTNGLLLKDFGYNVLRSKPKLIRIACDYFYNKPGYIDNVNAFLNLCKNYPNTNIRIHTITGNNLSVFESNFNIIHEQKLQDNWASQINTKSKMPESSECYFLKYNYCVILWDGSIVSCCNDYNNKYPIGHITNINNINKNHPNPLCKDCKKLQFAEGGAWTK